MFPIFPTVFWYVGRSQAILLEVLKKCCLKLTSDNYERFNIFGHRGTPNTLEYAADCNLGLEACHFFEFPLLEIAQAPKGQIVRPGGKEEPSHCRRMLSF